VPVAAVALDYYLFLWEKKIMDPAMALAGDRNSWIVKEIIFKLFVNKPSSIN